MRFSGIRRVALSKLALDKRRARKNRSHSVATEAELRDIPYASRHNKRFQSMLQTKTHPCILRHLHCTRCCASLTLQMQTAADAKVRAPSDDDHAVVVAWLASLLFTHNLQAAKVSSG